MAGKKGRSGRKSKREEDVITNVINISWKLYQDELNDPDVERSKKLRLASDIVKGTCPKEINLGQETRETLGDVIKAVAQAEG